MNREAHAPIWLEAAAALLVPAAAIGFSRVFELSDTVMPIIGASLVSSAVAVMCRRLRLPLLVTAVLSGSLLALLVMNRYAPGTARFGVIPTGETMTALRALVDELVVSFQEMKSPVPAVPAFVAAAMIGAWIMAFLTDWGALRLRLAFEPVFPSGLLFIFTSIPPVSAGQNRILSTVIYATAIAVWAVAQRVHKLMQEDLWLPHHERRGPLAVGRLGSALAAAAVLAGTIIGANLPWADAEPIYSFSPQQDPTRVVVSPFVNIRSRLVDQANVELFSVTADEPSYWRIAGLDTFEDDIWKVAGNFSPEDGDLPGQDLGGSRTDLTQTVSIKALAAIWLPAAFAPASISDATTEVTWNSETSSLTVANDIPDSDGVSYTVVSKVPAFSVDELRSAPNEIPDDIAERYLDVPGDITPVMLSLARDLTANSTNRYDQMRALQDHFRGYRYEVQLGPRGDDPIETFLAEQEGFCQQFAGTFALMARSLGVPTRVATGFTWGDQGLDDEGRTVYTVTGRHTHAWPEVYFQGLGWVPFEPTPGRGLPGASPYSGHTPAQDSNTQPTLDDTQTSPIDPGLAQSDPGFDQNFGEPAGGGVEAVQPPIWERIDLRYLLIPAALLAYAGLVLGLQTLRRRRRRARSTAPDQAVTTSWTEAVEAIELGFDARRRPSETRTEFAGRLRDNGVPGGGSMQQLAELSTVARFHPSSVTSDHARTATVLAAEVETTVGEHVPVQTRLLRRLDARRWLSSLAARATGSNRTITAEQQLSRPQTTGQDDLIDVT